MDRLCSVSPQDRLWGTAKGDTSSPTLEGEPRANRGRICFTSAVTSICFKPWAPDTARLVLWPVLRSGLFWLGDKGTPGGNRTGTCSPDPNLRSWVSASPLRFLWSYSCFLRHGETLGSFRIIATVSGLQLENGDLEE